MWQNRKKLRVQRRGATLAFTSLARHFGDELPQKLPKLWEFITEPFATVMTESGVYLYSRSRTRFVTLRLTFACTEVIGPDKV